MFCVVACRGGGITAGEASRLNKLVEEASSVVRVEPGSQWQRMRDKIKAVQDNPSHPAAVDGQPIQPLRCKTGALQVWWW